VSRAKDFKKINARRVEVANWLNLAEAAYYLDISETKFREIAKFIGAKKLPNFSRELRFSKKAIDQFMDSLPDIA
jgi:hypothetical protein